MGNVGVWWNYDKYTAGATVNYVDSFDQLYGFIAEVDSHTTLDLQASYDLTDNSRVTVGALNVTGEDPPWSDSEPEGYAFATAGHSPVGARSFMADVTMSASKANQQFQINSQSNPVASLAAGFFFPVRLAKKITP